MMATEQDLETGKEEEEVSKDLPNRGRVMIPGKEATDQLLMEEPKETLPVEVIVGDILEEGITGNPLETAMTGQTQETGTEINHQTSTEGLRVIPETVIIARMGRGMTETDVKEEVQVRKEKVTGEEMRIEEEREKLRNKKVKIVDPGVFVAVQKVTWLTNAPFTNQDPLLSAVTISLITKPLNAKLPGANLTILR